ncbi:MAG TPA: hypothetical protein VK563_18790 [Puia sp.]|nr:hypothetical protein [Puia sp.]
MKYLFICASLLAFVSCNSQQSEAKKLAEQINSTIMPGTIPTSEGSWTMKARIKGEKWAAASMMPPDASGRIIGYYKTEYIGLPYDRRDMYVGKKIKFGENNAVDLSVNDDIGMYGGRTGEMEITKVDDNWAEGKFYFTGNTTQGSNKTVDVTEGFFRISLARQK